MGTRNYLRSFAGGEISYDMTGRIDDVRFQTGAKSMRNFITLPHGPARNRPGTRYVAATKLGPAQGARIIPFTYSTTQTLIIEMGSGYFRFYDDGVQVTYSAPSAYVPNVTSNVAVGNAGVPTSGIIIGTDQFVFAVAHGFASGERICITPDDASTVAPDGVQYWTPTNQKYYYVLAITTYSITISESVGGAAVDLGDIGSGTGPHRVHRAYEPGTLVSYLGYDFHCTQLPLEWNGTAYVSVTPGDPLYWHQLTSPIFELANSYAVDDLFDVTYVQSNDVITFTHKDYVPKELRRMGETNWSFIPVPFAATLGTPDGVTVTATDSGDTYTVVQWVSGGTVGPPTGGSTRLRISAGASLPFENGSFIRLSNITGGAGFGDTAVEEGVYSIDSVSGTDFSIYTVDGHVQVFSYYASPSTGFTGATVREELLSSDSDNYYRITAVDSDGRESQASDAVSVSNNLFVEGAYNTITWNEVVGADHYRVYRRLNGLYGFMARIEADEERTYKDDGSESPDLGISPPTFDTSLSGTDYPGAVGYYQQRRVFGGTTLFPQQVWMTRTGTESDLTYSLPITDDDRVSFAVASLEANTIQHIVSVGSMLVLTSSVEYAVTSPDNSGITPTSILVEPQSYIGASKVKPHVINNVVAHVAARGGHVRALNYQATTGGFVSDDLSLRASHLFDGLTIVDAAYAKAPYSILWAVSSNGKLLGLTYLPDQEVVGWHQHDTDGTFESCAVVAEGNEDVLYVIVKRTVSGGTVRYIERLAPIIEDDLADMVFVDSAVTLTSPGTGQVGGMSHLVAKTVAILADGIVLPQQVVNGSGEITLATAYTKVTVGLPITADIETLPVAVQIEGYGQGRRKNVNRVWVRYRNSAPFKTGPSSTNLTTSDAYANSVRGVLAADTLADGTQNVTLPQSWGDDGTIFIRQDKPLPLTVVGLTIEVDYAG